MRKLLSKLDALHLTTVFFFILCIYLPAPLLNNYINYTIAGGSFIQKFHPSTYIITLISLYIVLFSRFVNNRDSIRYRNIIISFICISAVLALFNKGAVMSSIIDGYLAACMFLYCLSFLNDGRLRSIVKIFLVFSFINSVIVIYEFISKKILFYNWIYEDIFRPYGIMGNPIASSLITTFSILFLNSLNKTNSISGYSIYFYIVLLLSGVRGSIISGSVIFLFPLFKRVNLWMFINSIIIIMFGSTAILILYNLGAFDRFIELGLRDQSALSRINIFDALGWLNTDELAFGLKSYEEIDFVAISLAEVKSVESSFVSLVLSVGMPIAVIVFLLNFYVYFPFIYASFPFLFLYLYVLFFTLLFSSKSNIIVIFTLLGYFVYKNNRAKGMSR